MNTESTTFEPIATPVPRSTMHRRAAQRPFDHASPAAVDEVFANLAARQERLERGRESLLDPAPFRGTATEMDHQHQRLAQLLRDIAGPASE